MTAIKKLFSLKKSIEPKNTTETQNQPLENQTTKITYYQSGWAASIKASGDFLTFKTCLQNIFNQFEEECRRQTIEQENLKKPYFEAKSKHNSEIKRLETAKEIFSDKENSLKSKKESCRHDIVKVRQDPEAYGLDVNKKSKTHFVIGLLVLIPITLYLFVFYVSASFSAFFKNFESNDSVAAAIFDANALTDAFKASFTEGILVTTIPFVFVGLGFLIHMMQKDKSTIGRLKLGLIVFVTFLFDGLLAYQIEKKIYDFNKTPDSPLYNLKIAIGESEFWLIIFAGFIVYLIWGLVFDYVMKEHENLDIIKIFIENKKKEINLIDSDITNVEEDIENIKKEIAEEKGELSNVESKLNGFVFPVRKYLTNHHQYKEGWFQAINTELSLPNEKATKLKASCEHVCKEHLIKIGVGEGLSEQNIIFSKNN